MQATNCQQRSETQRRGAGGTVRYLQQLKLNPILSNRKMSVFDVFTGTEG